MSPINLGGLKKIKLSRRTVLLGLGTGLGLALLGAFAVLTFGIYRLEWSGPTSDFVSKIMPYPAATVGSGVIRLADYRDDVRTLERFYDKAIEYGFQDAQNRPLPAENRRNALDRLIRNELLRFEANRMGLTVSKEEIDGEFDRMVGEDPDAGVEDQIADLYGWTSEKFKEKVIGPYLLEQKLGYALIGERVDSVREKIEDGGDFGALASEYSDDTASAANGGDLGWFGRGEMVPEFESAAFSMEPGEVSPPIKTQFGYHIIRVEEVRNGQDGEVSEVHASHILVMNYGADDFLRERMEQANIKRFVALDGDSE